MVDDAREMTGKGAADLIGPCKQFWTWAFILHEVGNHWNILNERMAQSDLYIKLTKLWLFCEEERKLEAQKPVRRIL